MLSGWRPHGSRVLLCSLQMKHAAHFDEHATAVARRVVALLDVANAPQYERLRDHAAVSAESLRRFFSWHPAVWPTHGDAMRREIIGELVRRCESATAAARRHLGEPP